MAGEVAGDAVMRIATIVALTCVATLLAPTKASAERHHIRGCNTSACDKRVLRKAHMRTIKRWQKVTAPLPDSYLTRIGLRIRLLNPPNWSVSTQATFYGGYQFTASSWWSVGGKGYAHQATALEQEFRVICSKHNQGWTRGLGLFSR
jgi:hypothetical protein